MVNCVAGERSKKYAKKYFRSEKEEIENRNLTLEKRRNKHGKERRKI